MKKILFLASAFMFLGAGCAPTPVRQPIPEPPQQPTTAPAQNTPLPLGEGRGEVSTTPIQKQPQTNTTLDAKDNLDQAATDLDQVE